MKISLLNLNLVAEDAAGMCIIHQARFFRRRGDDVHIYVVHPPQGIAADVAAITSAVTLAQLVDGSQAHFSLSDLIIYHYTGRYELIESIRGIDRGTVVFYYHNITPPDLWGTDFDRNLLVQGQEGILLAHYADLCITVSPFNKQDLIDRIGYDPDRIWVLPLAVPLEEFTPGDRNPELVQRYGLTGQRILMFVGRMAGNKRIDLLVEALAQVKRHVPEVRLLLVGDDCSSPAYRDIVAAAQARARELGVDQAVMWTGRVPDLPSYLRLADVYVTASVHEGFAVPLIEAMACGVPVVASRAGAMPWVLGGAGLLADPGSAVDLADQILSVLQNQELCRDQVARGLERVKMFSLERFEAGLTEIIDRAVTYTLPEIAPELADMPEPVERERRPLRATASRSELMMRVLSDEIEACSDVALRGYTVRSHVPLLGPLIAWVRRTLTSHLREPYLDPTIERQVAYNRRVADWIRQAGAAIQAAADREAASDARIQALEAQVEALMNRRNGEAPHGHQERTAIEQPSLDARDVRVDG